MNRSTSWISKIFMFFLITGGFGVGLAQDKVCHLGGSIFVWDPQRDRDGDGLKDDLEYYLADYFKPTLIFDSDEGSRRSIEPVTLFQVRPEGVIGRLGQTPWRIWIKYLYLFQRDGGYGPDSYCFNDHNGDNEGATLRLESSNEKDWTLVYIDNYPFYWPDDAVQWDNGCHPVIYMSAHKHHMYFSTDYNHEDSVHGSGPNPCNDDVNGAGAVIRPNLHVFVRPGDVNSYKTSPNNVGEFPPGNHDPHYFVDNLTQFGYPGEDVWGGQPFKGGLGDDGGETDSNLAKLLPFGFSFCESFAEIHGEGTRMGTLRCKISDPQGKPIPGVKLYYRYLDYVTQAVSPGPWSTMPLQQDGSFGLAMYHALCLLRPVASRYDFKADIPRVVKFKYGESKVSDFTGFPVLSDDESKGFHAYRIQQMVDKSDDNLGPVKPYKRMILEVVPPVPMVVPDPQAADGGAGKTDPLLGLPRRFTIGLHVNGLLDANGNFAQSADSVAFKVVTRPNPHGRPIKKRRPVFGGPVAGCKLRVRLLSSHDLVLPASYQWIELTTDNQGNAYVSLLTGVHPGVGGLEVWLAENPANPWATFTLGPYSFEIQPALHGDDSLANPKLQLVEHLLLPHSFVSGWWSKLAQGAKLATIDSRPLRGDANGDWVIDQNDLIALQQALGKKKGAPGYATATDLNGDGVIDQADETMLKRKLDHIKNSKKKQGPDIPRAIHIKNNLSRK